STAVDAPYYHTMEDTPDKVDLDMLAKAVDAFDAALLQLSDEPPARFDGQDDQLWTADVALAPRAAGEPLVVTAAVHDTFGRAAAAAPVAADLLYDDFFEGGHVEGVTDANGQARLVFSPEAAASGAGRRFVHFSSGPIYPLVERVLVAP